jgi:glutaconyl-CoA decarboxylase
MKEYHFQIGDESYRVKIVEVRADGAVVEVNGAEYQVAIQTPGPAAKAETSAPSATSTGSAPAPAASPAELSDGIVRAPMPGVILKVLVEPGNAVAAEEPVLVLEAMKMENEIKAPVAGTLEKIFVALGASVNTGDDLFQIQQ